MKYYLYDVSTGTVSQAMSSKEVKMYKKMAKASLEGHRQATLEEFERNEKADEC